MAACRRLVRWRTRRRAGGCVSKAIPDAASPRRGYSPREWRSAPARLRDRDQAFQPANCLLKVAPVRSLAVDIGEIRAGERSAELREVEIELLEGSPGELFDIAHALFPGGGLSSPGFPRGRAVICSLNRDRSIHHSRHGMQWKLRSSRLRSPSRRRAISFASASIRSPRMWWWSGSWTIPKGRTNCGLACADCGAHSLFCYRA